MKLSEAIKAMEDGEEIQYWFEGSEKWMYFDGLWTIDYCKDLEFRLKPPAKSNAEKFMDEFIDKKGRPEGDEGYWFIPRYIKDGDIYGENSHGDKDPYWNKPWEWGWELLPEGKTRLMRPAELWGKALKTHDNRWHQIGEINPSGRAFWCTNTSGTIYMDSIEQSFIGWADHPSATFHEGFEVEDES